MSKVIKINILSSESIDNAIKEINEYKKNIEKKMTTLRERLTEEIANEASMNFSGAIVDDILGGTPRQASVTVNYDNSGKISVVVAEGEDAVWCEFGAGVYHNGGAGSSPHPKGAELGLTIGTYGKGYGSREVWGFPDENGEIKLTHGTPATMPMYNAAVSVAKRAISIAREVFAT